MPNEKEATRLADIAPKSEAKCVIKDLLSQCQSKLNYTLYTYSKKTVQSTAILRETMAPSKSKNKTTTRNAITPVSKKPNPDMKKNFFKPREGGSHTKQAKTTTSNVSTIFTTTTVTNNTSHHVGSHVNNAREVKTHTFDGPLAPSIATHTNSSNNPNYDKSQHQPINSIKKQNKQPNHTRSGQHIVDSAR